MFFNNREPNTRVNNTTKSTLAFCESSNKQDYDFNSQFTRQRQFNGNPVQPAATRQSYQDSNIFGYKEGSETVQKSASNNNAAIRTRENATTKSNVFGGDSSNANNYTINGAQNVTRQDKNWESNVFRGPQNEQSKRTKLGQRDKGREGLFGNSMEPDAYQRRVPVAAALSTKEATRAPNFDEAAAMERKNRELYGNSHYDPVGRENNRQPVPAQTGMDAVLDRDTRNAKAKALGSSILGNEGDGARVEAKWNEPAEKLCNPASSWASQNNAAKISNKGKIDPYRSKQSQLGSSVFEQTDYTAHAPLSKKEINTNDFQAQKIKTDGARPKTDINHFDRKDNKQHEYKNAKQGMLRSAFDEGKEYAPVQKVEEHVPSPVKGKYQTQNKKLQNLTTSTNLPGSDANQFYHQNPNKGNVVDFTLSGLSSDLQTSDLKRIAGVKHVISSEVELDALKGTCKGNGRIKIRLNEGEDPEQIRQNYINKGIVVQSFKNVPQKKSDFTRPNY